jgi:hypothetical protein
MRKRENYEGDEGEAPEAGEDDQLSDREQALKGGLHPLYPRLARAKVHVETSIL